MCQDDGGAGQVLRSKRHESVCKHNVIMSDQPIRVDPDPAADHR